MSVEWFIAKRYVQESRRTGFLSFITSFAILGIMLGTAALIIALSILDGFEKEIRDKVIGFNAHIQVTGFEGKLLNNYQSTITTLKNVSGVISVSPSLAKEAMIRFRQNVEGV